jgi:nitric oxide reductase NorD protein
MGLWKKLLEPEETVGTAWHALVGDTTTCPRFPEAAVRLERLADTLGVVFRGLGGDPGIGLRPAPTMLSTHRRRLRQHLGSEAEAVVRARIDGDSLFLPPVIDVFHNARANERLYVWLCAWAAAAEPPPAAPAGDPLLADLRFLQSAARASERTTTLHPGLAATYRGLCTETLKMRPTRALPDMEATVEACIVRLLGGDKTVTGAAAVMLAAIRGRGQISEGWRAPKGYRRHLPVPLWGEMLPRPARMKRPDEDPATEDLAASAAEATATRKARREEAPDVDRNDPLLLHRFEKILSWAEFLRINRGVDDEDEEQAKRATDDHDEVTLVKTKRRAATKLKFDLDLAPSDVDRERLSDAFLYPEWDYRIKRYHPDHCRVLAGVADETGNNDVWNPDAATRRRVEAVRRQFEALRPRREIARRQIDGSELDMDAVIRARCDWVACGHSTDRVYQQTRNEARDLAVSALIDVSRSTESYVENRQVLDVAKEALTALSLGLSACGDDHALFSFSSCNRQRVWVQTVKAFDEAVGPRVLARVAHLKPGYYTRLGAAIRHVAARLQDRTNQRRLLLVITDGKPNDLDHYEGRYGIEDTARAIREARRLGQAVFGITIDRKAQAYFPRMFGQNAFAIVGHVGQLTGALPLIYRHIVS